MTVTYPKRRAGLDAMDEALTPLTRALRRFGAGKPVARPKETPLGAVLLATEQRERLRRILESERDIESHCITHAAITIRLESPGVIGAFDDGPYFVTEGTESAAVKELENILACGHRFIVSGLTFVVQTGTETRVFEYRLDRTPEGEAALCLTKEKLIPGMKK